MLPEDFWNYSVPEVCDLIESRQKREKRQRKQKISQDFVLAEAVASRLLSALITDVHPLLPWDAYPELFADDKERYDMEREEEEFEKFKDKRRRFAAEHNRKIQGGGE